MLGEKHFRVSQFHFLSSLKKVERGHGKTRVQSVYLGEQKTIDCVGGADAWIMECK